ncbi:MAG: hypothetical protein ACRYFS_02055 [Janthinobacterium lividum]
MNFYREGYYLVPWRQTPAEEYCEAGIEADVPEDIYCETLADMGYEPDSGMPYAGIYFVRWPEDQSEPSGMK